MVRRLVGPAMNEAISNASWTGMLAELIQTRAKKTLFRDRNVNMWQDMTWQEFGLRVQHIGMAALARGLGKGDVACILAATGTEWLTIDTGLTSIGMVSAGIYPTEPPERLEFILADCGARILFVDSEIQLAKAKLIRSRCPKLATIVTFGFSAKETDILTIEEWVAAGPGYEATWDCARREIRPEDGAILIYTSGTTGPPKGALISQGAIAWQVAHSARLYFPEPGWKRPAYLPLCHIAERYFTFFAMVGGAISYMVDDPSKFGDAITDIRPEFILGVPRIFEKVYAAHLTWRDTAAPPGLEGAIQRGLAIADAHLQSPLVSIDLKYRRDADAELLRKARIAVGIDHARIFVSGGASFPPNLLRWFLAMGVPMLEMYGMSETGTIATNLPSAMREATVGPVCDFSEVDIRPNGEIAVRGNGLFSRYLNRPEATAAAFDGDWFLTGDLGQFDDHGHLKVTGRLKDIIITSGGKNISPAEIESRLRASRFIQDAVAIGDGRKFVSALVILDIAAVREHLNIDGDLGVLANHPDIIALIAAEIECVNATLSRVEQVKRFRILPRPLQTAGPELTPTLKLKRAALCNSFSELIEEIYA